MRISDLMKMGLKNLSRRKARTLLTVIGVVIGTISIVVMISIGIGMNRSFTKNVMEQGSLTTISVSANEWVQNPEDSNGNYEHVVQKLNDTVVEQIKQLSHVRAVSPLLRKDVSLYSGKYESWGQLYGMDSSSFKDFDFPLLESGEEVASAPKDAFIFGSDAAKEFYLWGRREPQIKQVDFNKDKVVMRFFEFQPAEGKKEFNPILSNAVRLQKTDNWEYDWGIYTDIENFKAIYTKYAKTLKLEDRKKLMNSLENYEQIKVNVDSISNVTKVQEKIKELGFQSSSLMMYLKPMQDASRMLQMVLGAVGGVAMLVSAISIANTMIMSIYERTKEIGIMKVLGCVIKDIKKLFLFEAAMIGLFGGIIGIILSYLASFVINKYGGPLFQAIMPGSGGGMNGEQAAQFSVIPVWLPILAASFAMIVGIISGYYPAKRATKISAIEAMKTEG